ncbi:hypothetical protein HDU98_007026 [Podochytrium sp. JEL0797]|nr:hypothetical protein HDU98_007026 [Podochytrium sp. JEL0797]
MSVAQTALADSIAHNQEWIASVQSNHMFIKPDDIVDRVMIKSGAFGVLHKADYLGTEVAVKTFLDIAKQESTFDLQKYIEREVGMLK